MKRWVVTMAAMLITLLASTGPSLGETAVEAALRWGLLGSWKTDCAAPKTRFDPLYVYVARGTALSLDRELGPGDLKDTSPIPQAVVQRDGTIELTIVFESARARRKNIMERNHDGRIRVKTNYDADTGHYSVQDGKLVSSSRETPWMATCR